MAKLTRDLNIQQLGHPVVPQHGCPGGVSLSETRMWLHRVRRVRGA